MNSEWQKLSESQQQVGYRIVTTKKFLLPDGRHGEFTIIGKSGAQNVATIALTPENKIIIAKQYRPGPEMMLYELPGGEADPGEKLHAAAARELREETGYVSNEPFELLGNASRDAYVNEMSNYFIARNCYQKFGQQLDSTEFIEILLMDIAEVLAVARQGLISDAPALLMAFELLQRIQSQHST